MRRELLIAVALLVASIPATAQHKQPTEAQCRELANSMLQTMRSTPLTTEEDKKRHREYMAPLEKKVAEIRARGGTDCELYAAIVDHVTR